MIIGRLGRDPEERATSSGFKLIGFTMAARISKEKSKWYEVTIWEEKIKLFYKKKFGGTTFHGYGKEYKTKIAGKDETIDLTELENNKYNINIIVIHSAVFEIVHNIIHLLFV